MLRKDAKDPGYYIVTEEGGGDGNQGTVSRLKRKKSEDGKRRKKPKVEAESDGEDSCDSNPFEHEMSHEEMADELLGSQPANCEELEAAFDECESD